MTPDNFYPLMTQEAIETIPMKQFQYWKGGFTGQSDMLIMVTAVIHDSWNVKVCRIYKEKQNDLRNF